MDTKTTALGRGAGTQAFIKRGMDHGNKTVFGLFGAKRKQKIKSWVKQKTCACLCAPVL
jgi:hypothetical protein